MAFPVATIVEQALVVPRQQVGAFLLLGIDKAADRDAIEAAWAQRLIWSRKGLTKAPLEDINWAREVLNDPIRRIQADAASFNIDTTDGLLGQIRDKLQGTRDAGFGCQPLDIEVAWSDYTPAVEVPTVEEVRQNLPTPEIPRELPAVAKLLEEFSRGTLDPWEVDV